MAGDGFGFILNGGVHKGSYSNSHLKNPDFLYNLYITSGHRIMALPELPKLVTRVRFPLAAVLKEETWIIGTISTQLLS